MWGRLVDLAAASIFGSFRRGATLAAACGSELQQYELLWPSLQAGLPQREGGNEAGRERGREGGSEGGRGEGGAQSLSKLSRVKGGNATRKKFECQVQQLLAFTRNLQAQGSDAISLAWPLRACMPRMVPSRTRELCLHEDGPSDCLMKLRRPRQSGSTEGLRKGIANPAEGTFATADVPRDQVESHASDMMTTLALVA